MSHLKNTKKARKRKAFLKKLTIPLAITFLVLASPILLNIFILEAKTQRNFEDYIVQPGDKLWSIAREKYGPEVDVRPYIDDIRQINRLDSLILHPGDTLMLPEE